MAAAAIAGLITHPSRALEPVPAADPAPRATSTAAPELAPSAPESPEAPTPGMDAAPGRVEPTPAPTPPPASAAAEPRQAEAPKTDAAPSSPMPAVPTDATVHIATDHEGTWLELRSIVDGGDWQPICRAPCDQRLTVDGMEARVAAPGMITSNAFRIEPGGGIARFRVSGGSRTARDVGLTLLIAGLPVTFGGMAAYGVGATQDSGALRTIGIIGLVAGGISVVASLPLLMGGSTNVRNQEGDSIASRGAIPAL